MRRSTAFVYTAIAALVFATPLVLFLGGKRSDPSFENRRLAAPPDLSITRLLDTDLYQEATSYFVDRVPLRDLGVQADSWIDYHLLGEAPNPEGAEIGAEQWLFNPETWTALCTDSLPDPAEIVANADLMMSMLEASGRDVAFTVSPQKRTVHPEHLGTLADDAACAEEHSTRLHDLLLSDPPTGYVDTWGVLVRAAREGQVVYFRDDTHWNFVGSALGAEAIVEHLWPGSWSPDDVVAGREKLRGGNLARQMGLKTREPFIPVRVERPGVTVQSSKVRPAKGTPAVRVYELEFAEGATAPGGATLALGDSFMEFLADEGLAPYTERLVWVNWRTLGRSASLDNPGGRPVPEAEEYFLEQLAAADAVLVQTVEWEVWQRLLSMRLTYLMMDTVSADLPHHDVEPGTGDTTVLPAEALGSGTRDFLVVRADTTAEFGVVLLHRDSASGEWSQVGSAASLREGLAVVDLRTVPAGGETAVRFEGVGARSVTLLRIVSV